MLFVLFQVLDECFLVWTAAWGLVPWHGHGCLAGGGWRHRVSYYVVSSAFCVLPCSASCVVLLVVLCVVICVVCCWSCFRYWMCFLVRAALWRLVPWQRRVSLAGGGWRDRVSYYVVNSVFCVLPCSASCVVLPVVFCVVICVVCCSLLLVLFQVLDECFLVWAAPWRLVAQPWRGFVFTRENISLCRMCCLCCIYIAYMEINYR